MYTFPAGIIEIYKLTKERILTLTRSWNFDDSLVVTLWAMNDKRSSHFAVFRSFTSRSFPDIVDECTGSNSWPKFRKLGELQTDE